MKKPHTYNDIWINGKVIQEGARPSEERYLKIAKFCENYKRPFSVLDIGAAEGYFTHRLASEFDGTFTAVEADESRCLLDVCKKNNNDKVFLLQKRFNLETLKRIAEVHYFDVILALNIIHHFDEPFQEVLDVIMSMCSYCLFEHPDEEEDKKTINFHRLKTEKLNLSKYDSKFLVDTNRWSNINRKLYQLQNSALKKIKRKHTQGDYYKEGEGIIIDTSFSDISVRYLHREENRPWILGMNLRLFLECDGVYPTHARIFEMIDKMKISGDKLDLGPANLLLSNEKIDLIDQNDHADLITNKKELKEYLISGSYIPNMSP